MNRRINKTPHALLLGAGYVATHLTPDLRNRGYDVSVTTRDGLTEIDGVTCLPFSGVASAELLERFEAADVIVSSIPPDRKTGRDAALDAFNIARPDARWIAYLSATSVYGDRQGRWAFEAEAPTPRLARGRHRAEAELGWIETGWPVHIFRLAGIYGPGRNPFAKLRAGTARAVIKPGHTVNRIHVDDIVSALMRSLDNPDPQAIYNLADGHPAPPQDVLDYAADLIDLPHPPQVSVDSDQISEMARSFYAETKRIDIGRARRDLGWHPRYPTYREGLTAVLKAESQGSVYPVA